MRYSDMGESAGFGSGYKEYVAGMLAGVATVVVGHPFDTVKVSLSSYHFFSFVSACFWINLTDWILRPIYDELVLS